MTWLQIASEDSILCLATRDDLILLKSFISDPTIFNASHLISIPAIYQVLQVEHLEYQKYSKTIVEVMEWLANRIDAILTNLVKNRAPIEPQKNIGEEEWCRVSLTAV